LPRAAKKRNVFGEVLQRHKNYIKLLEADVKDHKASVEQAAREEEDRKKQFMDKAQV
jgi:hypothetical protein